MTREQGQWWFTSAAIALLMLGTAFLEPLIVAALAGLLALTGLALFPAYRRRGGLALLAAAVAAAFVASAVRLVR